ncbi:MAG TPA: ABC transporter ATP-binding protein, partial [Enterococcus faecalis]|nr:ABC transporter ATP-binding protein [Enterococcus faecalis]
MIELKKTAVTLQQTPILKDISLVFPTGSKTCILGPNGCGKTTLLKTIAGLVPYSGSVLIDGQEVHGQKRKELATKVAMMSQFTTVAFDYTVYETVLMGAYRQQAQRFLPIVSKQ